MVHSLNSEKKINNQETVFLLRRLEKEKFIVTNHLFVMIQILFVY